MNKDQVLETLKEYLTQIIYHSLLLSELISCISKSGIERKFFTLLLVRLNMLSCDGILVADKYKEFESLGNRLFSMHLAGNGFNVRILFFFLPDSRPVLLSAFQEQAGKKKTDYSSHIPVAEKRKKEMEGKYYNGKERHASTPYRS